MERLFFGVPMHSNRAEAPKWVSTALAAPHCATGIRRLLLVDAQGAEESLHANRSHGSVSIGASFWRVKVERLRVDKWGLPGKTKKPNPCTCSALVAC